MPGPAPGALLAPLLGLGLALLAAAAGLARGQTSPPALPPASARDAVAAQAVKELFVVTATACEVELDSDGKVIGLEMAGTGRIVAFDDTPFHTARQLGPKKFAGNFGQYFPTAESTPNAALTGLDDADEPERAVFELKDAEFSRNGKSKNLYFSTRQTRSQARLNRLGSWLISNPTVNQQILTIQNALRTALRSCSLLIDDGYGELGELYDQDYGAEGNVDTAVDGGCCQCP